MSKGVACGSLSRLLMLAPLDRLGRGVRYQTSAFGPGCFLMETSGGRYLDGRLSTAPFLVVRGYLPPHSSFRVRASMCSGVKGKRKPHDVLLSLRAKSQRSKSGSPSSMGNRRGLRTRDGGRRGGRRRHVRGTALLMTYKRLLSMSAEASEVSERPGSVLWYSSSTRKRVPAQRRPHG